LSQSAIQGAVPQAGSLRTLVNGLDAASLPLTDRGLHYGDGLFETIAVRGSGPCLWSEHLDRLGLGAALLGIPLPDADLLLRECLALTQGVASGVVKLILTRGSGGRGYRPPAAPSPTRILALYPTPDYPLGWAEVGVKVRWCDAALGENPRLAGIKHLNRLEQVLARAEWDDEAIAEGLLCDTRGRVIAGTMSNVFVYTGGRLLTPRLDTCGVAGTVRAMVLRLAPECGVPAAEADLIRADLEAAEGVFLSNAILGIWPVRRLGGISYDSRRLPVDLIAAVRAAAWTPLGCPPTEAS
jgi:4-amino-4-deoxychorismate lyase